MTCHSCRIECKRKGRDRKGNQRYQCRQCSKTFLDPHEKPLEGMYLPMEKAEMILRLLLEGNSVSSVERITDVHHATIFKLLVLAGEKCERLLGQKIRNVPVKDVQADEGTVAGLHYMAGPQDDQCPMPFLQHLAHDDGHPSNGPLIEGGGAPTRGP